MNKLHKLLEKTHLDGGIAHAFWMLRYNFKAKLMNICFKCGEYFYDSINRQSQVRALKDLAMIEEQEQQGVYSYRADKDFLKNQSNEK